MRRRISQSSWPIVALVLSIAGVNAQGGPALQEALAAMERGDFVAAEQKLRGEVQARPEDAAAISLLGVALDHQRKFGEAQAVHQSAIAIAPRSADLLNNYANHLSRAGDEQGAAETYLKVVALDPAHVPANLELARRALARKDGPEALGYLNRLPANQWDTPEIGILRLQAMYLAGQTAEADALFARLQRTMQGDAGGNSRAGLAMANAAQFEKAEAFLTNALAAAPSNFGVLYNLGVIASRAGHYERAREVLETALRQRPKSIDVLYSLAYVKGALEQREEATRLLAQAAQLAPQRADIQKLLAVTATELRALDDAIAAWDRYMKLEPNDDEARRERGFAAVRMGRLEAGITDLEWYVARHPDEAVGHYQLGLARSEAEPARALAHLDKALALKTDYPAARSARGSLYYQMGKPEAAVADLEAAAAARPDSAATLDRLGQTYVALDRLTDAVRVLRKAAALAPEDSKIQLHLARALADAGAEDESKTVMDRFRRLGSSKPRTVPAGLVEYLSLTPEQREADYRARVEKSVRANPDDAPAQVRHLQLLIESGPAEQVEATARRLAGLKPGAQVLAEAGRALLESKRYSLARELLDQAVKAGDSVDVKLDLAVAAFHAEGAVEGIRRLDQIPEAERNGDYYLARAQMLDAAGRREEAGAAIAQAVSAAAAKRPDLYWQAAAFLMKNGKAAEASRLADQAARIMPQNREILILKAVARELSGQSREAEALLKELQSRWPEWHAVWVAEGIFQSAKKRFEQARLALETAVALGARSAEVYFYLAESTLRSAPERKDAAAAAIRQARTLSPGDQWIEALARRIESGNAQSASGPTSGEDPPDRSRLLLGKPPRDW